MQRDIKFRGWDEKSKIMHNDLNFIRSGCNGNDWIVFVSDKNKLNSLPHPLDNPYFSQQIKIMQFTGLKDKNSVEVYEGDLLNIFFTSGDGEYIHDCVYRVQIGGLGDVQFSFVDLHADRDWETIEIETI